jgi:polysaccharide biosynthesis/export protein
VSTAHPVKVLFFSAQAVLAAAIAFSSLTAGAQNKSGDTRQPGSDIDAVGAGVDPNKYSIGPEDVLFIKVWREPDFSFPVAVRPDGKITVPLVGDVDAAGQTPIELTRYLADLLDKYLNHPDVNVFVTEVRSKKYYIDGEVNHPGSFPLVTPTTVLEALSHAEGFKDFANIKKIRILRDGKVYLFNFKDVTKGKHMEENITVENGDHIIVP